MKTLLIQINWSYLLNDLIKGYGVLENEILKNAGADQHIGWAFGLGLDR